MGSEISETNLVYVMREAYNLGVEHGGMIEGNLRLMNELDSANMTIKSLKNENAALRKKLEKLEETWKAKTDSLP